MTYADKINALREDILDKIKETASNKAEHAIVRIEFENSIECTTFPDIDTNEDISIWSMRINTDFFEQSMVYVEGRFYFLTSLNLMDLASIADELEIGNVTTEIIHGKSKD